MFARRTAALEKARLERVRKTAMLMSKSQELSKEEEEKAKREEIISKSGEGKIKQVQKVIGSSRVLDTQLVSVKKSVTVQGGGKSPAGGSKSHVSKGGEDSAGANGLMKKATHAMKRWVSFTDLDMLASPFAFQVRKGVHTCAFVCACPVCPLFVHPSANSQTRGVCDHRQESAMKRKKQVQRDAVKQAFHLHADGIISWTCSALGSLRTCTLSTAHVHSIYCLCQAGDR